MCDVSVTAVCEMGNAASPVLGVFLSKLSILKSVCVCVYGRESLSTADAFVSSMCVCVRIS